MITLTLIFLPMLGAALVWRLKKNAGAPCVLLALVSIAHCILTVLVFLRPEWDSLQGNEMARWIGQDTISKIFLGTTSYLFLAVGLHTCKWLPAEKRARADQRAGLLPDWIFVACLLAFLGTMTLVISARNLGLLWVAVEATTLVSAPLILFHKSAQSLEAMWKYLLICSVGIGFALFGTMLLAIAGKQAGLELEALRTARLNPDWFKAAFIFALAGYGTKMGLAPFHTWLPDAHSEAPGTVSALLSGSLLNCSFLAIVRFLEIAPAPLQPFCRDLLIALGVFSVAVAAFFIIRQTDYKRMLAYSSVEHMGLIAVLWAIAPTHNAALVHLCGHSVLKMTLFLIAGNILLACGTRKISELGGLFEKLPRNSYLWIVACLLICGVPPSPLFFSEFLLIRYAGPLLGGILLLLLFLVFAGMTSVCLKMTMGHPGKTDPKPFSAATAETLCRTPALTLTFVVLSGIGLAALLVRILQTSME